MKKQNNRRGNGNTTGSRQNKPTDQIDEANMKDNPLHEAFLDELADVHDAEQQLIKALPKMVKAAQSEELREAIESHLEETREQVQRLQEVAASIEEKLGRKSCKGMEGLLKEATEVLKEHEGEESLDAVLIAGAQKVEHYEIASYGTLAEWARQMGHAEAVELLEQSLEEEKAADAKLTQLATSIANEKAEG